MDHDVTMNNALETLPRPLISATGDETFTYRLSKKSAEIFVDAFSEVFEPYPGKSEFRELKMQELKQEFIDKIPRETWIPCKRGELKILFNSYNGFMIFAQSGSKKFRATVRAANDALRTAHWQA